MPEDAQPMGAPGICLTTERRLELLEAEVRRPRRADFVQIGPDATIRRDMVGTLEWRRPNFANVAATSTLIITLTDGRVFKVEHRPNGWGGQDAYAIERDLLDGD